MKTLLLESNKKSV